MRSLWLITVLLLSTGALAQGAPPASAQRAPAPDVGQLRQTARSAREALSSVRAQQLAKRSELAALSARIETLKAQSKGRLIPGGELDSSLKQSQALSTTLSALSTQVSEKEAALETANGALVDALSAQLTALRSELDATLTSHDPAQRERRKQLFASIRSARDERDALRQQTQSTTSNASGSVALKASDDPEELLEQADVLRDNEEKLQRDLKVLSTRIAERREEAELDRRVQRFMGEESMFDDADRRLRVRQTTITTAAPPALAGASGAPTGAGSDSSATETVNSAAGTGNLGAPPVGAPARNDTAPELGAPINGNLDSSGIRVTSASDARVQVGAARGLTVGDDADLAQLEAERKRLEGLASQLKQKAGELEKRAAELK